MDLSQLLPQYPEAVLRSQLALIVLSLLERSGLSTDEDLQQELGIESHRVLSELLKLYQDRFTDYKNQSIQVSERGKLLLDALGLSEPIVDDILDSLALSTEERSVYRPLILSYRNESFHQYLNSVASIRMWDRLVRLTPKTEQDKDFEGWVGGAKLMLLLRDVRNWYVHSELSTKWHLQLPKAAEFQHVNLFLLHGHQSESSELTARRSSKNRQTSYAVSLLRLMNQPLSFTATANEPSSKSKQSQYTVYLCLFLFDEFQAKHRADSWHDDLIKKLEVLRGATENSNTRLLFLNACESTLDVKWPTVPRFTGKGSLRWWQDESNRESARDPFYRLLLGTEVPQLQPGEVSGSYVGILDEASDSPAKSDFR